MSIYRRYHTASHAAVLLGIFTFCVADPSPGLALLASVLVAGSWILFRGAVVSPLPRWAINLLLLGATANLVRLTVFSVVQLEEIAITLLAEYLIYLQLIKLYESRTPRDQAQLLVLNAMLVIGAVLTSVTIEMGAMLLLYTIVFTYTVMLYHLYSGQHRVFARRGRPAQHEIDAVAVAGTHAARDLRRITALAAICIVAGAAGVFVIMPRDIGNEFIGSVPEPISGATSGFPESVQLGLSGLVSESRDIVLEFDLYIDRQRSNTPVNQYLRGTVLDRYDPETRTWHRSKALRDGDARNENTLRFARRGRARLPMPRFSNTSIEQVVRIINKRTDHLFSLWRPDQVACEQRDHIYLNPNDATLRMPNTQGLVTYRVRSYPSHLLSPRNTQGANTVHFGASAPEPATPSVFTNTAVERYARRLMDQAGLVRTPDQRSDRLILQLFERHLRADFTYTLDLIPPPDDRDPLEYFLQETKSGHCEYFASAMAAMAQAVGIQARVVTGFVTNEIDPATGSYIVRKSHAHAWVQGGVQVAVDDLGDATLDVRYIPAWNTFDPTPPSELSVQARQQRGILAWTRRMFERAEQLWVRSVVAYNANQQKTVLGNTGLPSLGEGSPLEFVERLRTASLRTVLEFITTAVIALTVLMGVLFLSKAAIVMLWNRLVRRLRAWRLARMDPEASHLLRQSDIYHRMLRLLRRAGVPKPDSIPPLAFARSVEHTHPAVAASVTRLATLYYDARFGHAKPNAQQLDDAERELATLRAALNPTPKATT